MSLGLFFKKTVSETNDTAASSVQMSSADKEDTAAGEPAKKRTKRSFKGEWAEQFRWLRHEKVDGGVETMFCIICEKAGKNNGFTKGSIYLKKICLSRAQRVL